MDTHHQGMWGHLTFISEASSPNAQTLKAPWRLCICRKLFLAVVLTQGPSLSAGGKEFSAVETGKLHILQMRVQIPDDSKCGVQGTEVIPLV